MIIVIIIILIIILIIYYYYYYYRGRPDMTSAVDWALRSNYLSIIGIISLRSIEAALVLWNE